MRTLTSDLSFPLCYTRLCSQRPPVPQQGDSEQVYFYPFVPHSEWPLQSRNFLSLMRDGFLLCFLCLSFQNFHLSSIYLCILFTFLIKKPLVQITYSVIYSFRYTTQSRTSFIQIVAFWTSCLLFSLPFLCLSHSLSHSQSPSPLLLLSGRFPQLTIPVLSWVF